MNKKVLGQILKITFSFKDLAIKEENIRAISYAPHLNISGRISAVIKPQHQKMKTMATKTNLQTQVIKIKQTVSRLASETMRIQSEVSAFKNNSHKPAKHRKHKNAERCNPMQKCSFASFKCLPPALYFLRGKGISVVISVYLILHLLLCCLLVLCPKDNSSFFVRQLCSSVQRCLFQASC